jgi:hypothetical protein
MVKLEFGPSDGHMTILALFAQLAFMNIIFGVAFITGFFRFTVLLVLQVTGVTFH